MAASSVPIILLLLLSVSVETRPSPYKDDRQVLQSLFGSRLTSLMEVTPTPDDITEGSASPPTFRSDSKGLSLSHQGNGSGLARRQEVVHQFFLDFLRQQVKTRRWSRKSMVGGRGCFGMKLDRIGSISGLGC
ncbi:C-type natriuretic peptide 2 [Cyprinodon tularosa]|uniref:C-type natriuretic peptide 2 n=1 Tax=Cyprinodon tularosa TaxID=77115 RepID=UPI0018E25943|nr:C-type natriuretic peptide 2 [Cyprinodon tularosa]XP_038133427.1 C-type natriuretic peptide 2 [Cyprinodon tularosa]XP_038133428.1 C-type natriuretic peptide 2 [Cyprinodon tularosa]